MVSRRKLNQQTQRNSQNARAALANFKPAAPATPSYPNLGNRLGPQPRELSLNKREEVRNTGPQTFTGSFNSAFAAARKQGLQQFQWNGKLYGTQLAKPKPASIMTKSTKGVEKTLSEEKGTYFDTMRRGELPQVDVVASRLPSKENKSTYFDTMGRGSLPQVDVVAKRVSTAPIPAPVQPAQNTPSADSLGWGSNQGPYRSAGIVTPMRGFDNRGAYSTTGGSFTRTTSSNPNYETSPQTKRYAPSYNYPGVRSNKKGGKLGDVQQEFVAYLIQASGVETEDELNDYIQDLGQDGLQRELAKFEELMTQGTEQVPAAAKGAKLNYIKSLRGQCPEGFEMEYFKKGGVMCSQCIKKAKAQKAPMKAEQGTKVVQDFKADMQKCGGKMKGKMKKKENGGNVKIIPGVIDTKENKLSPKGKVQIKKHYFGGKF